MNTQTTGEASVGSLCLWIAAQRAEARSYLQAVMAVPNHARTDEQEIWGANMTGRLAMLQQMDAILAGAVDVGEPENDSEAELREISGWIGVPPGMMEATVSERVRHTLNALQISCNEARQQIIALEAADEHREEPAVHQAATNDSRAEVSACGDSRKE